MREATTARREPPLKTTPFYPRTAALCVSHAWRRWAGYIAASSYELTHEREYHAIRSSAGLLDISPLYKYRVYGKDAVRLLDRMVTRDVARAAVGQVLYTPWCDAAGKVLDDGTVARLGHETFRLTSADPTLRWLEANATGLDVTLEDVSESTAALALQGPNSRAILQELVDIDLDNLKYFGISAAKLRSFRVTISRTGYTGDLGYEIWVPWEKGEAVWDALMAAGRPYDITAAGMLALDVARIEAGLILLDVDYVSARKALIPSQRYSPYEIGLGRLVNLDKAPYVGQQALRAEAKAGSPRQLVGLEVDWDELDRLHDAAGLPPQVPLTASRVAVPVYDSGRQVGKATSSTWSPTLKKMIALATLSSDHARPGSRLEMELTVNHERQRVGVTVKPLPFFDPPRKRGQ
ncbi:MAG TPA: aminomethyltransferase family protein [Vicinamibacteria bacterium]|nr:aminomethyltransferase family protein [Vicinamibacteria bacterium]